MPARPRLLHSLLERGQRVIDEAHHARLARARCIVSGNNLCGHGIEEPCLLSRQERPRLLLLRLGRKSAGGEDVRKVGTKPRAGGGPRGGLQKVAAMHVQT